MESFVMALEALGNEIREDAKNERRLKQKEEEKKSESSSFEKLLKSGKVTNPGCVA